MNIPDLYRKIKQVLNDTNASLINRGLSGVKNLTEISSEIDKLGSINRLPYRISEEILEVTKDDLNGITSIAKYAFRNCTSLTNVTIPDSVTSIGDDAFWGCTSLTNIYLNQTTPPSLGNTSAIPTTTTIHIPIGSGDAYKTATNWSYHSSRIVEDIEI